MSRGGLVAPAPDRDRIALGIRQPWCELILRGRKTLEIRTRPTEVRGTIYVYSAKKLSDLPELEVVLLREEVNPDPLPKGSLVGTVEIVGCRRATPEDAAASCVPPRELENRWAWELAHPIRFAEPVKPRFLPYGVWFYPFKRRSESSV
ncbi:ASCH domain-containing protein [Alienimonas californiensis]|uniref:ASCH domain protein n=1 Tax=Alienimonas californiensis TaxID=2527989 RepID=A0A517PC30_9PLAN|nr:ASCH domain-containing protein [Alienimonas californiensis]QDT16928.1 ASCH domain protein [Alienimonas californiensis]